MANFITGLIIGSMISKNKSNGCGPKSIIAPKPKLPPLPSVNIGTNPPPEGKSTGPPGSSLNKIISLKFCKAFDWNNIEIVELDSFEEFFF